MCLCCWDILPLGHGMTSGRSVQQTAGGVIVTLVAVFAAVVAQNVSEVTSQPPVVVHGPKPHILYNSGQLIQLPCVGTGEPQPRYEWYRDGELVPAELLQPYLQPGSGSLMLHTGPGQSLAEGRYQCRVVNQWGVGMSNVTFIQEAVLFAHSNRPQRVARNVTATAGESVTLPCNHTRLSIPDATFDWYSAPCVRGCHGKKKVKLSERITMDEKGNLVIGRVEESDGADGKIYKCEAENPYRRGSYFGSPTRLIVKPNQHQNRTTVPKLKFASQSPVVALVGHDITLDCFYIGWPIPNVSWTIQSSLYDPDRIIRERPTHKLTILDVKPTDAGDYHCNGRNGLEGEGTTIRLVVEEIPVITEAPASINATEGDDVTFTCGATGVPVPSVQWYINEYPLHDTDVMLRYELRDDSHTLVIYRITMEDRFTVHCNISNVHGYQLIGAYLNVLERPPPPPTTVGPTTTEAETTEAPPVETTTEPVHVMPTVKITSTTSVKSTVRHTDSNILRFSTSTRKPKKTTTAMPPKNGSALPVKSEKRKDEEDIKHAYENEGTIGLKSAITIYVVLAMLCLLPILLIVLLVLWRNRSGHTYNVEQREKCRTSSLESCREQERLYSHLEQGSSGEDLNEETPVSVETPV